MLKYRLKSTIYVEGRGYTVGIFNTYDEADEYKQICEYTLLKHSVLPYGIYSIEAFEEDEGG